MLYGCIPIRVGSRLRGLCEPPCHPNWGWTVTNRSHLPFDHAIDWSVFPEFDEAQFAQEPTSVLSELFQATDATQKAEIRDIMQRTRSAWVYGWGNPVNATVFGNAVRFAWESFE